MREGGSSLERRAKVSEGKRRRGRVAEGRGRMVCEVEKVDRFARRGGKRRLRVRVRREERSARCRATCEWERASMAETLGGGKRLDQGHPSSYAGPSVTSAVQSTT